MDRGEGFPATNSPLDHIVRVGERSLQRIGNALSRLNRAAKPDKFTRIRGEHGHGPAIWSGRTTLLQNRIVARAAAADDLAETVSVCADIIDLRVDVRHL